MLAPRSRPPRSGRRAIVGATVVMVALIPALTAISSPAQGDADTAVGTAGSDRASLPYMNPRLPVHQRVKDLRADDPGGEGRPDDPGRAAP